MNCPLCKKHAMDAVDLAPDLPGFACNDCSGVWIARPDYDAWRVKQPGDLPEKPAPVEMAVTDTHKAKTCPQCGHLLLPYRVGHGLSFSIDHCGTCGGVWLDQNEWEAIKAKNLHASLHEIVSAHWQAAIRRSDAQESVEQTYKRLLGASYSKAFEIRAWLGAQPQKSLILAYLSDMKPEKK